MIVSVDPPSIITKGKIWDIVNFNICEYAWIEGLNLFQSFRYTYFDSSNIRRCTLIIVTNKLWSTNLPFFSHYINSERETANYDWWFFDDGCINHTRVIFTEFCIFFTWYFRSIPNYLSIDEEYVTPFRWTKISRRRYEIVFLANSSPYPSLRHL